MSQFIDDNANVSGEDSGDEEVGQRRESDDDFIDDASDGDGSGNSQGSELSARAAAEAAMRARDGVGEGFSPLGFSPRRRPRRALSSVSNSEVTGGSLASGGRRKRPRRPQMSPAGPSRPNRSPRPRQRTRRDVLDSDSDMGDDEEEQMGNRRESGRFPLNQEMAMATANRARFQEEIRLRRERGEARTGFTPDRELGPAGGEDDDGRLDDEEEDDPVDLTGPQDFRDGIAAMKILLADLRAKFPDPTSFAISRDEAENLKDFCTGKLTDLGDIHANCAKACRTPAQRERLTDLSRRVQLAGHSLVCMSIHMNNMWNCLKKGSPRDSELELHCVEEFMSLDDLYKDKAFTPFHQLLTHIMDLFNASGYKREGEDVFERVYTTEGHKTIAWKRKYSIEDFINRHVRKSVNTKMWLIKSKEKDPVPRIVKHLCSSNESEFSSVNKSRTTFSFENGVYDADNNDFFPYPLPSDSEYFKQDGTSAAKHFDGVVFPEEEWRATKDNPLTWRDIDTSLMDSVLKHQEIDDESIEWLYFSIGRMLYPIGTHDDLQYFLYFDGTAGCGKSTIIKVIQNIYDKANVGVVSNNIETTFGLSSFQDKWMCIAPEIKDDWKISVTEFQSMASGESVSIAVKNKNTIQKEWESQLAMAGNEIPGFSDIAGSVSRRLLVFKFINKPSPEDGTLLDRIKNKMGHLLLKSNVAYRYMTANGYDSSLWNRVTDYFQQIRAQSQRTLNPLVDFMESGTYINDDSWVEDSDEEEGGYYKYSVDFNEFKDDIQEYAKVHRNGEKLKMRMFELHKMKAILNQYGFKIGYEKKNGQVIKTRIGSIQACRKAVASDFHDREAARNARRTAQGSGADVAV